MDRQGGLGRVSGMGGTFISVRRRPVVILRASRRARPSCLIRPVRRGTALDGFPGQQGPAWPTFLRETGREFAGPSSSKPDGKQGYGPGSMPGRGEGLAPARGNIRGRARARRLVAAPAIRVAPRRARSRESGGVGRGRAGVVARHQAHQGSGETPAFPRYSSTACSVIR